MLTATFKHFFLLLLFYSSSLVMKGQTGLCPPNLDFEAGDFSNWVCRSGSVAAVSNVNTITWFGTGQVPGQHTIISSATAGTDPYGGFPELCPNGSGYSVRLGNNSGGHNAESITYTYTIPATLTNFSMIFNYAVVLQDPSHMPWEQPRFRARITDLTGGAPIPCVTFDFTASGSLPGFQTSPFDGTVRYKDWTPITINLNAFIGRTIELEFITSDCIFVQHFGYAYIDVNTNCNGAISGTTICQGDNSITLSAPFGFQSYRWFSDNTFSTVIGTNQTLPLNPAPAVGTVMPVEVTPYNGFGCMDTLYATITISPKPVSRAGPDVSVCKYQAAQLGASGLPGHMYEWRPAGQVSNPLSPNPTGVYLPPAPNEFIVKTTDILTGCFSEDTTYVSGITVDTAIRLAGNVDFCVGEQEATLTAGTNATSVQWYDGTTPVPGATSTTFLPAVTGNYWAQVVQNGCTDTTATIAVRVHPIPTVSFYPDEDTLCVTNNSFLFHNTSSTPDNSPLTYNWKFSDGTSQQLKDAVKTFSAVGRYDVKLIASSGFGCDDSTSSVVYVMPNGIPDFTWDSVCVGRPVVFTNLSSENGSPLSKYTWDFKNGGPGSGLKDPLPVTYTTAGIADVTLEITNLGCETDPKTISKPVQVNRQHTGVRYRDITVPEGASKFIHIRDSVGTKYSWQPQLQLSKYDAQYTEFFATGNDVLYLIDITDEHTCVTKDTILMQVLKKPGYYLPTGFTPNGDGLNDVARPYLVKMKALKSFSVFNRWGLLLFHSTREGEGWDGTFKGEAQNTGVYIWILEFYTNDNKLVTEKGTITLIR